jgi:AraC-like DNA-binding protein
VAFGGGTRRSARCSQTAQSIRNSQLGNALAERTDKSRSIFALRFKETVGASPDTLAHTAAGDRLTHSGDVVSTIALSHGYKSECAFITAFKRVMRCSPRQGLERGCERAEQASQREPFTRTSRS